MFSNLKENGRAVALGNFDGLHLGHQKVLSCAVSSGLPAVALVIHCPFTLLTRHEMECRLLGMGVQPVFMDFSAIRGMTGRAFVQEVLDGKWNAARVCCGYNFHFGSDRCTVTELESYCRQAQIHLSVTPQVCSADGVPVSSTRIRAALRRGDMEQAAALLGRPYGFTHLVESGDRRGRTIGFPTINQQLEASFVLPRFGVYASRTLADGQWYPSVSNVGVRPTYQLELPRSETHLIGYQGDLYGCCVTVELLERLRDEERFDSLTALKGQIAKDRSAAIAVYRQRFGSEIGEMER